VKDVPSTFFYKPHLSPLQPPARTLDRSINLFLSIDLSPADIPFFYSLLVPVFIPPPPLGGL